MPQYLEYIWIDGLGNVRSKVKIMHDYIPCNIHALQTNVNKYIPQWSFDGSSTGQAEGYFSDVLLNPIAIYYNPFRKAHEKEGYIVLCETLNADGTPHSTNHFNDLKLTETMCSHLLPLFGVEQEYIIYDAKTNQPLNFNSDMVQGDYYCSTGGNVAFGRHISEEHIDYCLMAGIKICGTNAEVTPAQWEFQIGVCDSINVCNDLWVARYILNRVAEKYNCWINYHPKPLEKYNGSGCHTNFSTKLTRASDNGLNELFKLCEKLKEKHSIHMEVYGVDNELRLTGNCETASINSFSYGVGDRGASIRIPLQVQKDGYGYLEDRRPASNMDPYLVVNMLLKTCCLNDT